MFRLLKSEPIIVILLLIPIQSFLFAFPTAIFPKSRDLGFIYDSKGEKAARRNFNPLKEAF